MFRKKFFPTILLGIIKGIRFLFDISAPIIGPKESPNLIINDVSINSALKIRVYTPRGNNFFPIAIFIHGGGWIIGSVRAYDRILQYIAYNSRCVVVGVNYRKMPEHSHPRALEDVFAAYRWIQENASLIKGDKTRIGLIGDSAGGNIAIQLAHKLDKYSQPINYLALIYPVVLNGVISCQKNKWIKCFGLSILKRLLESYFGSLNAAQINFKEGDPLKNIKCPKILIIAADKDPLTELITGYVARLKDKGIKVDYYFYPGSFHGFLNFAGFVPSAKKALKAVVDFLKEDFEI